MSPNDLQAALERELSAAFDRLTVRLAQMEARVRLTANAALGV